MDDEEAAHLAGHPLDSRQATADFAQSLIARGIAKKVIVARGSDGSVLVGPEGRLFCKAPKVKLRSRVGAGDSFVGGYVLGLARGLSEAGALSQGVASAAAAVMSEATELCRLEDVQRLIPEAWVEAV